MKDFKQWGDKLGLAFRKDHSAGVWRRDWMELELLWGNTKFSFADIKFEMLIKQIGRAHV